MADRERSSDPGAMCINFSSSTPFGMVSWDAGSPAFVGFFFFFFFPCFAFGACFWEKVLRRFIFVLSTIFIFCYGFGAGSLFWADRKGFETKGKGGEE